MTTYTTKSGLEFHKFLGKGKIYWVRPAERAGAGYAPYYALQERAPYIGQYRAAEHFSSLSEVRAKYGSLRRS